MKINAIFTFLIVIAVTACRNDKGPLPVTANAASGPCSDIIYFTDDISPVISAKCATSSCHVPGHQSPDLSSYIAIKSNIVRVQVRSDDKTMPSAGSPPLLDSELQKLDCWIKQGYPNNSKDPSKASGNSCSTTISYSLTVAPIISANCSSTSCHGAGTVNSVDFSNYVGIQPDAANGTLYSRVVTQNCYHAPPVVVNPPLTGDQISKISCWIQQGALNN